MGDRKTRHVHTPSNTALLRIDCWVRLAVVRAFLGMAAAVDIATVWYVLSVSFLLGKPYTTQR